MQGNPGTLTDPDGHCWPLCTMVIGAVIGAAMGAATSVVTQDELWAQVAPLPPPERHLCVMQGSPSPAAAQEAERERAA